MLILICMILLVGTVAAADYRFQNKTPSDLVVIHGDTGNLSVAGNMSTEDTGFFGFLGSLVSRITKLFVIDIDFTGYINGTGNITTIGNITGGDINATTNIYSGGFVNATTDICIEGGTCLSDAGTGSGDITEVNTNGPYLTGGSDSGIVNLLLNETVLNATIDSIAYNSWNEIDNGTFAYVNEPYWTGNYTAYNDSWTSTDSEIWNVIANDTYVPYTGAVSNVDLGSYSLTANNVNVTGNLISDTIHQTSSQGLVLSMSFNNNSVDGLNVLDASGQNNHGTVENDTTHNPTGGFNGGGAYDFDGDGDEIIVSDDNSLDFGTGNFTISLWINSNDLTTLTGIIVKSKPNSVDPQEWGLWSGYNAYGQCLADKPCFLFENDTGTGFAVGFPSVSSTQTWYHLLVTRNGSTISTYLNGDLEQIVGGFETFTATNTKDIHIGSIYSPYFWDGLIDNIQIWSRALSADEIAALYYQRAESLESFVSQRDVYVDSSGNVNLTTGSLSMFNKQIHDLANATSAQDAVALSQLQAVNTSLVGDYVPYTGATQNVDLGSKNITASWFKGIFNWIIGATSTNYLSFNGTQLNFDESALNATIDSRAVTSETDPKWTANYSAYNDSWSSITNTSYYLKSNPFGFWNDTYATFNKTYADTLYSTVSEPLWTANYSAYNDSWSSTYNATYDLWAYNQTIPAVNTILGWSYYNSTDFDYNDYYLKSNPFGFWNDTYATFNKTYADTLYSTVSEPLWTANYTAYNDSWTSTDSEIWNIIANDTYVPYTGAVSNVDLGAHNFTVDTNVLHVDSSIQVQEELGLGQIVLMFHFILLDLM